MPVGFIALASMPLASASEKHQQEIKKWKDKGVRIGVHSPSLPQHYNSSIGLGMSFYDCISCASSAIPLTP